MDVSIIGIKGYEFQYRITIYLALQFKIYKNLKILVEPQNGEDILLRFVDNSSEYEIQVQVKREASNLDESKLLKWLCHFEPRKGDSFLLSKLIKNESIALFVTKSRCNQQVAELRLKPSENILKLDKDYTKAYASNFNKILKESSFFKNTKLGNERNNFVNEISKQLDNEDIFKSVFNRIKIIEEFDEGNIDYEVNRRLSLNFGIPQSKTEKVYLLMLEALKEARDNQTDLANELIFIIKDYKINSPKISKDYVQRDVENSLIKELSINKCLLLTGISFCGKSEMAKSISSHFTEKSHEFNITSNIQTAESFYYSNNVENDKILILEDPFGHIETFDNAFEISSKLQRLIDNLDSNHKLIVTSQKSVLATVYNIEEIESKGWHDITILNNKKALSIWDKICNNKSFESSINEKIKQIISLNEGVKTLQIGQIEYLSRLDIDILNQKSIEELDTIARYNAKDIGRELDSNNKIAGEILILLSFCGNALSKINIKDLAYILSDDKKHYTLIKDKLAVIKKEQKFNFKYHKNHKLDKKKRRKIEYLEERGFIKNSNKTISIVHPNYFEAGRFIFLSYIESKQLKYLKLILKAIASYNSNISYFSSKQLNYYYSNTVHYSVKKELVSIAFKGLESIFPSTKDNCLVFLISIYEELKYKNQSEVSRYVSSTYSNISRIKWYQNHSYIVPNHNLFNDRSSNISSEKATSISKKLELKQNISNKSIWKYLVYLDSHSDIINTNIIETLLLNKDSFVRAKATQHLFSNLSIYFKESLILKVFEDDHPLIVFKSLSYSLGIWHKLIDTHKEHILPLLFKALERKDVAIRSSNLMTTFSVDYASESIDWRSIPIDKQKDTWELWHQLFLIFQKNVPSSLNIHAPRFTSTMDAAINFLDKESYMDILNCWYERLDKQISIGMTPDDHEFSLAMNLMKSTSEDSKIRKELFLKLMEHTDTGFLLSSLKWFISHWNELSCTEKTIILDLLKSDRIDSRWIKAVAITSHTIPIEIQEAIFGDGSFLSLEPELIINEIEQGLLFDSLCVHFGKPQPLWWLAFQGRNYDIWKLIYKTILLKRHRTGYSKCLNEFLFDGVNGFQNDWDGNFELWTNICLNSKDLNKETSSLIYATASCTCNLTSAKKLWDIIILEYRNRGLEDIIVKKITKNIVLLQHSEREHISKIIDIDILNKVLSYLNPDASLFQLLFELEGANSQSAENKLIDIIDSINDSNYIKMHVTHSYIKSISNKLTMTDNLKQKLSQLPNILYEKGKLLKKPLDDKRNYKLDNWVGKN